MWRTAAATAALLVLTALAGCGSGTAGSPHSAASASLTAHVGVYGGPVLPNGHMAASNQPQPNVTIVLTDSTGRRRTARTDADGNARFTVPAGRYTVRGPCSLPKQVTLTAGRTATVQLPCDVP